MTDARTPARAWLLPFEDASALYRFDGATLDRSLPLGATTLAPHAIDVESDTFCYATRARVTAVRGALARDPLACGRIAAPAAVTALAIDGRFAIIATSDPRHALAWCDLDSHAKTVHSMSLAREDLTVRWLSVEDDRVLALSIDRSATAARWLAFERPFAARASRARTATIERAPARFAQWQIGSDARRVAFVSELSAAGLRVDVYDSASLAIADSLVVGLPRNLSSDDARSLQSLDLRDETLLAGFSQGAMIAVDLTAQTSAALATSAPPSTQLVRAALLSAGEALVCFQQGTSSYRVERRSLVSE